MNDGSATRGFSLKDQLFNAEKVRYLGGLFGFGTDFDDAVMARLTELELKQRITWIAKVLGDFLPDDYPEAVAIIRAALPPPLDPTLSDNDFGDFILAPLSEYVVQNGMAREHLNLSLSLLRRLTKRFSVEYAIRHFLNDYPDETMATLAKWARFKNYHVRRLVSEGTRPNLPWGVKINLDISDPILFLDQLHADTTRFVTRSVANHMNDIAKKDPELAIKTLKKWRKQGRQDPTEMEWIIRHALRSLVKQGHPKAMKLLGFNTEPALTVTNLTVPKSAKIGEVMPFRFDLHALANEGALIDYVIDFVKANGTTAPKVFKLKTLQLSAGETVSIDKKHRFVKGATTFTHYPGEHRLTIQINGNAVAHRSFTLT